MVEGIALQFYPCIKFFLTIHKRKNILYDFNREAAFCLYLCTKLEL